MMRRIGIVLFMFLFGLLVSVACQTATPEPPAEGLTRASAFPVFFDRLIAPDGVPNPAVQVNDDGTLTIATDGAIGQAAINDSPYLHVCASCVYTTIQDAVDASSPGDTLIIHGGDYVEDIVMPHSLNLLGYGVDAENTGVATQARIEGSIVVSPSNGLHMLWNSIEVYNSKTGARYAVKVAGTNYGINLNARRCYFYANDDSGTATEDVVALDVRSNNVKLVDGTNVFAHNRGGKNAYGIQAQGAVVGMVQAYDCTISANTHDGGVGTGVRTLTNGYFFAFPDTVFESHGSWSIDRAAGVVGLYGPMQIQNPISGTVTFSGGSEYDYIIPNDLHARTGVAAKTSGYTLPNYETAGLFTNASAGGDVTFTLPGAAAGLNYCFYVYTGQAIYIDPATGDQIHHLTNATGDRITDNTIGDSICLTAVDTTYWVPTQEVGTWTDAD